MNKHLRNLKKIEFVITDACTGRCRHCSEGEHPLCSGHIDADIAAKAVKDIASEYSIETVMAFGGEPLLYPDAVCKIMTVATELKIPKRQVITNGFFTVCEKKMSEVAHALAECGVNDLLLSADSFHQEYIPLERVKAFALKLKDEGVPVKIQPAWLVSRNDTNPYNEKTKEILNEMREAGFEENEGNVIFPEGNAVKFLSEYFDQAAPVNPYVEDPTDIKCLSFSSDGSVLDGNIYECDIIKIIEGYNAKKRDEL